MVTSALSRSDEQLLCAAVLSNCWCLCLFLCVCLEGRACSRSGGGMRLGSSWRWQLSRAMRLALRWCRLCCPHRGHQRCGCEPRAAGGGGFWEIWSYSRLLLRSLCFNSLSNTDTLLDCAFEPVYWVVDNVTRWFGVVRLDLPPPPLLPPRLQILLLSPSLSCRSLSLWLFCSRPPSWL